VRGDAALSDGKFMCDLFVGLAARNEGEDVFLPRRKSVRPSVSSQRPPPCAPESNAEWNVQPR
jgi:hypothetical protein